MQIPKDKSVLFKKKVKQKSEDNNLDFLNKDYYKDNSKSAVKRDKENNSNSSITLRKAVSRDSDSKKDILEK